MTWRRQIALPLSMSAIILIASAAFAQSKSSIASRTAPSASSAPTLRTSLVAPTASPKVSRFRLTPIVGVSSSSIEAYNVVPEGKIKNQVVGLLGLLASFDVSERIELVSGLVGFESGAPMEVPATDKEDAYTSFLVLRYIGLPLMVKFNASANRHRTLYAKTGLMPATMIGIEREYVKNGELVYNNDRDSYNSFDTFASLALGGSYPLARGRSVQVEATYQRGLLPVNTKNADQFQLHNSVFNLNFGFNFDL